MAKIQTRKTQSKPGSENYWLVLGFTIFLLSRLCVAFGYELIGSDVGMYYKIAQACLTGGRKVYTGVGFPYPPLAFGLIYLPALITVKSEASYHLAYQALLFLVELGLVTGMMLFTKRVLKFSNRERFYSLCFLTVFGLLQGQLIYERIDMGVALFVFACLWAAIEKRWFWLAVFSNLGVLYKFVPLFPAAILRLHGDPARGKGWLFFSIPLLILPALLTLLFIEKYTNPGVLSFLVEHGERGIQIESIWASPFMLLKAFYPAAKVGAVLNYGAHHLTDETVSDWYLILSKLSGFVLLAGIGLKVFFTKGTEASLRFRMLTPLAILLVFISTQRVLSPQFFIWLFPFLAIQLVVEKNWKWTALTFAIYGLTYVGYDLGYIQFLGFDPFYVCVVAARNLCLMAFMITVCRSWFEELKNPQTEKNLSRSPTSPRRGWKHATA